LPEEKGPGKNYDFFKEDTCERREDTLRQGERRRSLQTSGGFVARDEDRESPGVDRRRGLISSFLKRAVGIKDMGTETGGAMKKGKSKAEKV